MKVMGTIVLAAITGFLAGALGSQVSSAHKGIIHAEAIELADTKGNRVFLGIKQESTTLQFFDAEHHLRTELSSKPTGGQLKMVSRNQRFEAQLSISDQWPAFSMQENRLARLGFGLVPDDTGNTSAQHWLFYSGAGGINGAAAILGSRIPWGNPSRFVRGSLDLCCSKNGSFWTAPPPGNIAPRF